MKKPKNVNILGKVYTIEYVEKPMKEEETDDHVALGRISYVDRKIFIYDRNRGLTDLWDTILHEVLHGVVTEMVIRSFESDETHDDLDRLAIGLSDTLIRNGWLKF